MPELSRNSWKMTGTVPKMVAGAVEQLETNCWIRKDLNSVVIRMEVTGTDFVLVD